MESVYYSVYHLAYTQYPDHLFPQYCALARNCQMDGYHILTDHPTA